MRQRKYTKEEYEEVLRLRELGYGYLIISRMTGVKGRTVFNWYSGIYKPRSVWDDNDKNRFSKKCSETHKGIKHTYQSRVNMGKAKIGVLNPMWKGNNASPDSARQRAYSKFKAPKGKEIHHIDGNPYNNEPDNILFLTRKEHMIKDGRLEKLIKNNKERWRFKSNS